MFDLLEGVNPALRGSEYGLCTSCWSVVKREEFGKHQHWHFLLMLAVVSVALESTDTDAGDIYA